MIGRLLWWGLLGPLKNVDLIDIQFLKKLRCASAYFANVGGAISSESAAEDSLRTYSAADAGCARMINWDSWILNAAHSDGVDTEVTACATDPSAAPPNLS